MDVFLQDFLKSQVDIFRFSGHFQSWNRPEKYSVFKESCVFPA